MRVHIKPVHTDEIRAAGAAAARRGDLLLILVDGGLSRRRQRIAALKLMTDAEFAASLLPQPRAARALTPA